MENTPPKLLLKRLEFTPEQEQMIRDMYCNGATKPEADVLIEIARSRGLSPILGEIHFVKRHDQTKGRDVWSAQVGIDGFRTLAERTGVYDGQGQVEFSYESAPGVPSKTPGKVEELVARVQIHRKDIARPFIGEARYREYVQTKSGGGPNYMWTKMPANQLAKCAEAAGHRRAFPSETSKLFDPAELPEDDNAAAFSRAAPASTAGPRDAALQAKATEFLAAIDACASKNALRELRREKIDKDPDAESLKAALREAYNAKMAALPAEIAVGSAG